jgi:hypothetical protein
LPKQLNVSIDSKSTVQAIPTATLQKHVERITTGSANAEEQMQSPPSSSNSIYSHEWAMEQTPQFQAKICKEYMK